MLSCSCRKADHWPQKLLMQLIPKSLISNFGGAHFRNARSVMFHPQECEALEALAKVMSTGYVRSNNLIFLSFKLIISITMFRLVAFILQSSFPLITLPTKKTVNDESACL